MAETLESIKQEIAKIAAEKADLKGIVDQQKETIKRQETTIGNLQEAIKATDIHMVERIDKLNKEIIDLQKELDYKQDESDDFKEALDREVTENAELQQKVKDMGKTIGLKQDEIDRVKKSWDKDYDEYKEEVKSLKAELEKSKAAHAKTWEEKENFREKNLELKNEVALLESIDAEDHHEDLIELREQVAKLEAIRDTYAKEIDVLNGEIEELKANGSPGMIAALAAKDEELRKLGEKVPAKDREINDLKEQVKSLEKALDHKGDECYRVTTEKEHLANAIENAYRSLMITRGYQLPDESGVSNG